MVGFMAGSETSEGWFCCGREGMPANNSNLIRLQTYGSLDAMPEAEPPDDHTLRLQGLIRRLCKQMDQLLSSMRNAGGMNETSIPWRDSMWFREALNTPKESATLSNAGSRFLKVMMGYENHVLGLEEHHFLPSGFAAGLHKCICLLLRHLNLPVRGPDALSMTRLDQLAAAIIAWEEKTGATPKKGALQATLDLQFAFAQKLPLPDQLERLDAFASIMLGDEDFVFVLEKSHLLETGFAAPFRSGLETVRSSLVNRGDAADLVLQNAGLKPPSSPISFWRRVGRRILRSMAWLNGE